MIRRKAFDAISKADYVRPNGSFSFVETGSFASLSLYDMEKNRYKVVGVNEQGNILVSFPGTPYAFGIDKDGYWDKTLANTSFWTSPVGSGSALELKPFDTKFLRVESITPMSEADYVNHELIFTGIGSDGIHMLYREYTFEIYREISIFSRTSVSS